MRMTIQWYFIQYKGYLVEFMLPMSFSGWLSAIALVSMEFSIFLSSGPSPNPDHSETPFLLHIARLLSTFTVLMKLACNHSHYFQHFHLIHLCLLIILLLKYISFICRKSSLSPEIVIKLVPCLYVSWNFPPVLVPENLYFTSVKKIKQFDKYLEF